MSVQLELFDLRALGTSNSWLEYKIKTLCKLPNKALQIFRIFEKRGVILSLRNVTLLSMLAKGKTVTKAEIEDEFWGHDPEGGPLTADNVIRFQIWQCRQEIAKAKLSWKIKSVRNVGYKLTDY